MFWLCDSFIFKDHLSKLFVSRRYTEVVPLLSKMVCKMVRGWERFKFIMFPKILSQHFLSHLCLRKFACLTGLFKW